VKPAPRPHRPARGGRQATENNTSIGVAGNFLNGGTHETRDIAAQTIVDAP
jgi:hypothetical protein